MTSLLSSVWQKQVKGVLAHLHGHQSKVIALFVLGAIRAQSIVLPRVAEALLLESEAKASSIERRLERFLSNRRIEPETTWDEFLSHLLSAFQGKSLRLVIDLTPYEEHAQIIYVGLVQQSRVLPLAWKVMPGQETWESGLWDNVDALFQRISPFLQGSDCTLLGDSAFGCFPMVRLCEKYHWHYLFRICASHTCQPKTAEGTFRSSCSVASLVPHPGNRWYGAVRLWKETPIDTQLSAYWKPDEEDALLVISDRPAGGNRLQEYRLRWRVESTFQDFKSRGWDWEQCHIRRLDRLNRLLLVLFIAIWWLTHLAASCIHHGWRDRYDRHDRRDKGIFRLGRLYLLDLEHRATRMVDLLNCLLFRRSSSRWLFSLRF